MYINDLASVLRNSGLRVVETDGWKGNNNGEFRTLSSIVCHHTGGAPPSAGTMPSLGVVMYGRFDLDGPLANIALGRDGVVYVVSNGLAHHAGSTINDTVYGNANSIGIEAENTGTGEVWPQVQVDAYVKICAVLCEHYNIPAHRVKGHKEICYPAGRKIDPANLPGDMEGFRSRVQNYFTTERRIELMDRYHVSAAPDTTTIRVRLPGGPNAKIIIRPCVEGGVEAPVWLEHVYAWGSDKQGVGGDPMNIPGYNGKVSYSREVHLPNAVWADVQYSTNSNFIIDCVG